MNVNEAITKVFEKAKATVVKGSFTTSPTQYAKVQVELGFEPDMVLIYQSINNNGTIGQGTGTSTSPRAIPVVLTKAHLDTSYSTINSNGFLIYTVTANITLYYIAIKF